MSLSFHDIQASKNFICGAQLSSASTFTQDFSNLGLFVPDYIIIKSIIVSGTADNHTYVISCSGLSTTQYIGSFTFNQPTQCEIKIPYQQDVPKGSWTFTVSRVASPTNSITPTAITADIAIHFEFVKLKVTPKQHIF